MSKSYRDKLRLMIVLLLALSVGLSGAWLITSSFDGALEREVTAAQTEQRMALYMLAAAAGGREDDAETLTAAVRTLERQTGQPFRLTGVDGAVLYEQARGSGFQGGLTAQAAADTEIGSCIGSLPDGVSRTAIQADFYRCLRELKLEKYKALTAQPLELDLRENTRVKSE